MTKIKSPLKHDGLHSPHATPEGYHKAQGGVHDGIDYGEGTVVKRMDKKKKEQYEKNLKEEEKKKQKEKEKVKEEKEPVYQFKTYEKKKEEKSESGFKIPTLEEIVKKNREEKTEKVAPTEPVDEFGDVIKDTEGYKLKFERKTDSKNWIDGVS